ncbi:hypothetical protein EBZ37_15215, partial [bacterium]|nr:hypothetical protein [bacterium]
SDSLTDEVAVCESVFDSFEPHIETSSTVFDRLLHTIHTQAWASLTRRFHPSDARLFVDAKVGSSRIIYVATESERLRYLSWLSSCSFSSSVRVSLLPELSSVKAFASLEPGILALHPDSLFLVPGGRFNEMYGWDSYFMTLGILGSAQMSSLASRRHLAQTAIDQVRNLSYQVLKFGKIHNATRSYFVNRSNPPFLSSLVKAVRECGLDESEVVREGIQACRKELLEYWLTPEKTCEVTGLGLWGSRSQAALCVAVESGHYDDVFSRLAIARGVEVEDLVSRVSRGDWPKEDLEVWKLVQHDLAVRESGHDTTERLVDSAGDLVTADLNSLLFKSAKDLFELTGDQLFR